MMPVLLHFALVVSKHQHRFLAWFNPFLLRDSKELQEIVVKHFGCTPLIRGMKSTTIKKFLKNKYKIVQKGTQVWEERVKQE
jgi:hypothetical protein